MNKTRPVYWELKSSKHDKFWAVHVIEEKTPEDELESIIDAKAVGTRRYRLIRKWGKIGTKPQSVDQIFYDIYEAEKALDIFINNKESKGYKPIF